MRFIPHGLTSRLLLTYLMLVLLSVGGLIVWTGVRLQAAIVEQQQHNLGIQAQLVANALRDALGDEPEKRDRVELQSLVDSYAQASESGVNGGRARVTIVDDHLRVLASSDQRVIPGREHNHTEFQAARSGYEEHEIRWDEYEKQDRLFVASPIQGEHDVAAFVQLSISTELLYDSVRQMWLGLGGVGGIILALTVVVSLVLANGIARPIQKLTRTSEAIANGELERRVAPEGPDEIERLGHSFNQMTERLQELITREKEFAGNAAHELRSPLTSLRLRLELVQNAARDNPIVTQKYLEQMESEVRHLQRVVDQLLALAELEEGAHVPRTDLDPAPLLYDLADELSPLVRESEVEMRVEVAVHLAPVHANPEQVRMAVRNLLENAFKYTPPRGTVVLSAVETSDSVEIAVSDTGVGIPSDALPHIFDRFYRVDTARRNHVSGSGLGLALAKMLVQANSGSISVESQPGKGSIFRIQLPQS